MKRNEIISRIGNEYLISNIENDEFKYSSAFKAAGLVFPSIRNTVGRTFDNIDIRFVKDKVSILVETKRNINDANIEQYKEQLNAYVEYEKNFTGNKIVSILASTDNDDIMVWRGAVVDSNFLNTETRLKTFEEYEDLYEYKVNDKETVMKNTYALNELLHSYGINEALRSQFVGTCLLALKNGLEYQSTSLSADQIRVGITGTLEALLNHDINKATKLALLNQNVIGSQDIKDLSVEALRKILKEIDEKILPYINDKTTAGQDLLNLFFVTFNKYVGKKDKNQAFTPDHITDFMAKVCKVNKNSIIMDPCCGSGSFLVRAMTMALDDCLTREEQEEVKKHHIYGIEYEDKAYGLATTNMLIHSDGNSNIWKGSCFDLKKDIIKAKPNVILMNPPYNATQKTVHKDIVDKYWKDDKGSKPTEDPTKGLCFVKFIIDILNDCNIRGKMAVLLPVSCAIGSAKQMIKIRKEILEKNTLDAVFTMPADLFHPGATASSCCMVFNIGEKHSDSGLTFFGYYKDDGFKKKKNLGRVEIIDTNGESVWSHIEEEWLDLYLNRKAKDGLSCVQKVKYDDEWLCEAYMKTDYSRLTEDDFQQTINNYLSFLVKEGKVYEN